MDHNNQWVKLGFTDIDGLVRGKFMHQSKFKKSRHLGYCDVVFGWDLHDEVYPRDSVSGWKDGFPDANATIDLETERIIPWDNVPFYLVDFSNDDKFSHVCPRSMLKSCLKELGNLGYNAKVGYEYEWFNYKIKDGSVTNPADQTITSGMYGYSIVRLEDNAAFVSDLMKYLAAMDIIIEGFHTETGPGVYEAAIKYGDALESADRATLFKHFTKIIAKKHNILASFMAKWNASLPGCSGHIHISLLDSEGTFVPFGKPMEHDVAESFLAGVIQYMDGLLTLYNPFVNSYKRLVAGSWAPTKASWGIQNRTASVRIIPGSEKNDRFELRIPGSDANPYLALYACLKSGMYGIKQKLKLKQVKPIGNAYEDNNLPLLSTNLGEAAEKLLTVSELKNFINNTFLEHYAMTRKLEYQKFMRSVTDWEIRRYLEII